jgi:hypothetical protein
MLVTLLPLLIGPAQATTWAFQPGPDDFRPTAMLDLRSLNEKVAGESGPLRVDANGDMVLGNGKAARLWCAVTDVGREKPWTARPLGRKTEPDLARHARFLAKRGVNMVRLHRQISPNLEKNPNAAITDIDETERDAIWRTVAAMKKEGIYCAISPYWGVPMKFSPKWNVLGGHQQSALGLLFFDPQLQAAYKAWLKKLYAEKNPYTGIALAQDASVGVIQLQNEDSLLFWTVNGIAGPQRERLERLYGDWLRKKHGGDAGIARAWSNDRAEKDGNGRYELLNIWEMTQKREGGRHARLSDQTEFYARTMHDFNREMVRYLRQDLGCKQLINAGNWKTADNVRLNDVERWSYTPAEVDAVNHYFGGVHRGPNEGWAISNGDKFTSISALQDPRALPINLRQTAGRPMLVTESAWVMPNGFAAEGPFLVSVFQSLTGVDGYFWFATGDDEWTPPQSANGYMPSQGKWLFGNPDMLGTFPAAALLYRMGYVQRANPALTENRALEDLWQRRTPILAEESGFDPFRDAGDIAPRSSIRQGLDPMAYLVGPIQVRFDADPAQSKAVAMGGYKTASGVKSQTGQVVLDPVKGFCTVDAPMAQGVAAHFSGAPLHRLSDTTFSSRNTFGAALAVSLDGKPLKSSARVLVQYGTECRPTGWATKPATITLDGGKQVTGYEVTDYGRAPWQIQTAALEVVVKNPALKQVHVLDANGNAVRSLATTAVQGGARFSFPAGALYVVLTP